ncbi:MAG: FtsQ-type POTRA domain-containing protein, partial [Candidatus Eremiobacteraeota bacterium]|nr:FtsQ-type POTRA domain-containing protein [Candidatus Eremiobacteraeota bacterium]
MRTFWLLGLVALVAIVWGGWTLLTLPALRLKSLAITGLERVSRGDVLARAHIDPTANVWLFDRNAIARRIEVLPFVDTARVHVRPLANVWIDVTERRADACLRDAAGRRMTIDAASRLLEDGCDATLPTTYTVRGKIGSSAGAFLHDAELDALRRDGQTLAADGDRFRLLSHDGFGGLQATMYD